MAWMVLVPSTAPAPNSMPPRLLMQIWPAPGPVPGTTAVEAGAGTLLGVAVAVAVAVLVTTGAGPKVPVAGLRTPQPGAAALKAAVPPRMPWKGVPPGVLAATPRLARLSAQFTVTPLMTTAV